jgi:trans-aconitate methyltransferase
MHRITCHSRYDLEIGFVNRAATTTTPTTSCANGEVAETRVRPTQDLAVAAWVLTWVEDSPAAVVDSVDRHRI